MIQIRKTWIDILKGIGIISVVLGHAQLTYSHYFYWFHMPLFFFVSGLLYRQKNGFILRRTLQLLVPYSIYFILLSIIQFKTNSWFTVHYAIQNIMLGGQNLGYYYGVFWFITCLWITSIVFHLMVKYLKRINVITLIICSFYFLSYLESTLFPHIKIWWDADVALFALAFYYLGWIVKEKGFAINGMYNAIPILSVIFLAIFAKLHVIHYKLDMKAAIYNHLFMDILIPLSFIFTLIFVSRIIESIPYLRKVLAKTGEASLTVMYIHVPLMIILLSYGINIWIIIFVITICPILLYFVFQQIKLTRWLLLGDFKKPTIYERVEYKKEA